MLINLAQALPLPMGGAGSTRRQPLEERQMDNSPTPSKRPLVADDQGMRIDNKPSAFRVAFTKHMYEEAVPQPIELPAWIVELKSVTKPGD